MNIDQTKHFKSPENGLLIYQCAYLKNDDALLSRGFTMCEFKIGNILWF